MYLNKLYRSDKYCEIPKCDDFRYGCNNTPCGHPLIPNVNHQNIEVPHNTFLTCGCPAFEYNSHNKDCELFNSNESENYPIVYGNTGIPFDPKENYSYLDFVVN
jgi:hypothetical protein